jgi:lipopolysaccharide export system protein LptA
MKCVKASLPYVLVSLLSAQALALDSDSKQPMYIEADSATHDEGKGETVYIGNVRFTQGSIETQSDKMIVYQKDGKTQKVVNFGKPTRIKQKPEPDKPDWHGVGQRAEYYPDTGVLILFEDAMAWQGENPNDSDRVTSDRIEYDSRLSVMKAGTPNRGGKRVHVTIHPEEGKE